MNIHKNARLTPNGRERIVRQVLSGRTPKAVSQRRRLPADHRQMGRAVSRRRPGGVQDRSSRAYRLYRPTPDHIADQVGALRRQRYTGKQIAAELAQAGVWK
ncbi:MAG: Integrase catalytic region [Xanthobacteraceae bacterium]|nr:Integrase catalytic region [Xanthobacteraceae bacterium]